MTTVFAEPPVLCGHRGMGVGTVCEQVENTLGSFLAVLEAGLRWVEVDVRITVDDVLVARHDPVLEDGRFVADLPAEETDELGLLRVADLLDALPADAGVDIEIKTSLEDALRPRGRTTAALVAGLLADAANGRGVLVTSFDPAALVIVRERAPKLALGLLTWLRYPLRKAIPAAVHLGVDVIAPHVSSFGVGAVPVARLERPAARHVAVAHEAGLEVAAWCPTPAEAERLVADGVDCLIVDHSSPRTWVAAGRPVC